nr:NADH-quinone oxidoreductase subunit C [Bacillus alkalicellulosilyticus]
MKEKSKNTEETENKEALSKEVREESSEPADEKAKAAAAAKAKAAAAAKAKAAALAKQKAQAEAREESSEPADEKAKAAAAAKAKAAAAAKAKAAALAKQKAQAEAREESSEPADEKAKAAAAAKAKAAAAAKAKAAAAAKAKSSGAGDTDDEKAKAKAAAVAKAKAAAAARAKAASASSAKTEAPIAEGPLPNQDKLDKYVKVISDNLGEEVLEDAYINKLAKHVPTLVAKKETYYKIAQFLKHNEVLSFDYLSELHGSDFETHMEIYNHFYSFKTKENIALKVKIDRDQPEIDSLATVWEGANWPEREAYDLLGIQFSGHPNLTRIMLPDDWVGYPLRKDYEPHDEEV